MQFRLTSDHLLSKLNLNKSANSAEMVPDNRKMIVCV